MAEATKLPVSEASFTDAVIQLAKLNGWMVAHFRPCRTMTGWKTAVQGDVGFPDIVCARDGKLVFMELKSETGRMSPEQVKWMRALTEGALGYEVRACVYRPDDWGVINEVLA